MELLLLPCTNPLADPKYRSLNKVEKLMCLKEGVSIRFPSYVKKVHAYAYQSDKYT